MVSSSKGKTSALFKFSSNCSILDAPRITVETFLFNILDKGIPLIDQIFDQGNLMYSKLPINEIRTYVSKQFGSLPDEYKDIDSVEKFNVEVEI